MGLLGLFGGDKDKKRIKKVPPRPPIGRPYMMPTKKIANDGDDDNAQAGGTNPWQQSIGQAKDTRGKFWNNIKSGVAGQSWHKPAAAKPKRRRH